MDEMDRVYISEFTLDLEPATLTNPLEPTVPQVMMRQSKDGGKTWLSERWTSAGAIGEYFIRLNWHRCGMGRRMVFEVSFTAATPYRITNAYLKIKSTKEVSRVA
jgi:hypothetical protein